MRPALVTLGAVLAIASCASEPEREWMKVNERYTVEQFRRDHAECSRKGKLDEACMHARGWVDVKRPAEKPSPLPERPPGRY
ncbi:MAG: hypothetical protein HYU51_11040 [Candidatus Rokubacteria bacterium]|nr:hypothetical protein [Candidatus Rokubacteria bacterium]